MAMTYQNFASLGVNLNRQKYGPLDISNVFTSAADLKYYLTKGTFTEGVSEYWYKNANEKVVPYPYEGQVLATVIDGDVKVYVLRLDAEGAFEAKAIEPEVDGKTIKLTNGKLELVGLPTETSGKTYVPSLVNGVLTWAEPDTSTAEGQQQAIDGLTTRMSAVEATVNGKPESSEGAGDAVVGLVDKVAALEAVDNATQAELDAYKEEVTTAITDLDTAYKAADSTTLTSSKTYTDEEIIGLDVAIEQKEGVEYIVIKNKAGAEVASVNASKFVQDSFLDDVSYDSTTGKVTFTWKMGDGSTKTDEIEIGDLVDTYTAGTGLTLSNNQFAVNTDVIATVEALDAVASDVAETYATKDALNEAVEGIENDLLGYVTNDAVETELAKKADVSSVYTKTEVDAKIGVPGVPAVTDEEGNEITPAVQGTGVFANAYSRAEVDKLLDEVQGGSSASADSVLRQLNTYKSTNDERVSNIETKNSEQDTAIATAQAQADKGVGDAAKVAGDLATLGVTVADNTREIGVAKSSIDTVNTTLSEKITALENADVTIKSDITSLQGIVTGESGHASRITALESRAANLEAKDTELAALIQSNTDKFADYSTTEQVNKAIDDKIAAIPDVDFTGYATETYVGNAIAALDLDNKLAAKVDDTAFETYKTETATLIGTKANAADVYTKADADEAFMTEGEVDARINALINAADPEGGKTITDIQNLVKYVEENAGEIAGLITTVDEHTTAIANNKAAHEANASAIEALQTTVGQHTTAIQKNADDITAINTALAGIVQPKASEEITVAADGTLGLGKVSTDKLEMGANTLVIDGGSAV